MKEEWKDITGYEGLYEVSNLGRIKSLSRLVKSAIHGVRKTTLKYLTPSDNGHGYKLIGLSKDNKRVNFYVHRLVAEAFVTRKKGTYEVNHLNFNLSDNRAINLEWVSSKGNSAHKKRGGRLLGVESKTTCPVVNLITGSRYTTMRECARAEGINHGTLKTGLISGKGVYKSTFLKLNCNFKF